jgi:glutamate dehydrogenase
LKTILQHLPQRAMVISHPILNIMRKDGVLTGIGEQFAEGQLESFMIVQFEGVRDLDTTSIEEEIRRVFQIAETVGRQRKDLNLSLQKIALMAESQDQKDFTDWLLNGNFICFGHASVEVLHLNEASTKFRLTEAPLGWLPDTLLAQVDGVKRTPEFTKRAKKILVRKHPLVVEILQEISPIYQQDNLIYLGFRESCKSDRRVEHIFVGLFSQNSVNELASNILPLKTKLLAALNRQHVPSESYDYRKVVEIFNTFPMFFLSNKALDRLVQSFVSLQRQQSVKLVVTRSLSLRGVTLLVIMPRDYYSRDAVRRMESYLGRFLSAQHVSSREVHFYSEYVSLHFRVVPQDDQIRIDVDALQKVLTDLARPWEEKLRLLILRGAEGRVGLNLWSRYADSFPKDYKELIHPRFAIRDVRAIEQLLATGDDGFDLWGPFQERQEFYRLQFYSLKESYLNELMPFLENLALAVVDEVDFFLEVDGRTIYVKSFAVRNSYPEGQPLAAQRDNLLKTLTGLRKGIIEDDYLNRLMVLTGLDWQEIDVFRAYRNYYFQLGNPFTKRRVAFTPPYSVKKKRSCRSAWSWRRRWIRFGISTKIVSCVACSI